jgi:phenylacetate-CoA ligase
MLEVSRRGHLDDLEIRVEMKPEFAGVPEPVRQAAAWELQHHIKSYIGINTQVTIVETGRIERSSGKIRRVVDRREA